MSRRSTAPNSKLERLQDVPWVLVAQVGVVLGQHWLSLSAKERARLTSLVRDSRGQPSSLGAKQRLELRRLVNKLDLGGIARDLLALQRRGRGRRGRRRGARA
ncbi:MAG: hypothetical protein ACLP1Q_08170 [Solirubrobacteraceae bacterium]